MLKAFAVLSAAVLVSLVVTPRAPARARLTPGRAPVPPPRGRALADDLRLN